MEEIKLKDHLLNKGFKQLKVPWQFELEHKYRVVFLGLDSWDFETYSIISLRYDSVSYRGRILTEDQFDLIFALVQEDYTLEDSEKEMLNKIKNGK